jgi:hypothetical protein
MALVLKFRNFLGVFCLVIKGCLLCLRKNGFLPTTNASLLSSLCLLYRKHIASVSKFDTPLFRCSNRDNQNEHDGLNRSEHGFVNNARYALLSVCRVPWLRAKREFFKEANNRPLIRKPFGSVLPTIFSITDYFAIYIFCIFRSDRHFYS